MAARHVSIRNRNFMWMLSATFTGTLMLASPVLAEEDAPKAKSGGGFSALVESLFGGSAEPAAVVEDTTVASLPGASHIQSGSIKVKGNRTGHQLQAFCLNKEGLIFAVVAAPRSYGAKLDGKNNTAEIRVYSASGEELRQWPVDFAVQSIAASPSGHVFVAGNGHIAKFDSEGKLLKTADAPHIAALLKNSAKLKEEAEAALEEEKEQYEEQVKALKEQVEPQQKMLDELKATVEAKPEAERTAADKRKIRSLELAIKNMETQNKALLQHYKQRSERKIDDVISEMTSRLKIVNALAATDQDVFIASGVTKGYGYAIWRTNHDFDTTEQIVTGLSGCCGQMDIGCCDDKVFVAENSRKRVLQYDRDGKKIGQWGEGNRNGAAGAGFGGCCNPMNVCFGSNGEVLTSESEGYIKKFTKEGSFLGVVGQAKVSGGCKNVAIAMSPTGDKAYFFDLQGSRIVILDKKTEEDETSDKEASPADAEPAKAKPVSLR